MAPDSADALVDVAWWSFSFSSCGGCGCGSWRPIPVSAPCSLSSATRVCDADAVVVSIGILAHAMAARVETCACVVGASKSRDQVASISAGCQTKPKHRHLGHAHAAALADATAEVGDASRSQSVWDPKLTHARARSRSHRSIELTTPSPPYTARVYRRPVRIRSLPLLELSAAAASNKPTIRRACVASTIHRSSKALRWHDNPTTHTLHAPPCPRRCTALSPPAAAAAPFDGPPI